MKWIEVTHYGNVCDKKQLSNSLLVSFFNFLNILVRPNYVFKIL